MKPLTLLTLAGLAALAAGCDRPGTRNVEAPNTTTTTTTAVTTQSSPSVATTTQPSSASVATSDRAAPNAAAAPGANDTAAPSSTAATGPNTVNAVSDTVVTTKVKTAITADNGMKDADISVKTENGIVTLAGNARTPDQVTLAAALAQRQDGVTRVENQVVVR